MASRTSWYERTAYKPRSRQALFFWRSPKNEQIVALALVFAVLKPGCAFRPATCSKPLPATNLNLAGRPGLVHARRARPSRGGFESSGLRASRRQVKGAGPWSRLIERVAPWLCEYVPVRVKRAARAQAQISMQREELVRLEREGNALENRLWQVALPMAEERASRERIKLLRRKQSLIRSRLYRLKQRMGEKWLFSRPGTLMRTVEIAAAANYRASSVFFDDLSRRSDPLGALIDGTAAALRLGLNLDLVVGYFKLREAPRLVPHALAIYAKMSKLERFAPGILKALSRPIASSGGLVGSPEISLDGGREPRSYLDLIEPHLDEILERFDVLEPHVPFALEHLPLLAPHIGTLLKHLDALLMYASDSRLSTELLDYLPYFVPRLDALALHLEPLRPHIPRLLPVLPLIAPHVDRFAPYVAISANADVLLCYFGWIFQVPGLRRVLLSPALPPIADFLARRLPRWPCLAAARPANQASG